VASGNLTPEEKYEIAQQEAEALKDTIEKGRIKSDAILETLRVIVVVSIGNFIRNRYGYCLD